MTSLPDRTSERLVTAHILKTWPRYFNDVAEGRKTFEVRAADRDFKQGDLLDLREYDPSATGGLTGRQVVVAVTYICDLTPFVGKPTVGMGIALANPKSDKP